MKNRVTLDSGWPLRGGKAGCSKLLASISADSISSHMLISSDPSVMTRTCQNTYFVSDLSDTHRKDLSPVSELGQHYCRAYWAHHMADAKQEDCRVDIRLSLEKFASWMLVPSRGRMLVSYRF